MEENTELSVQEAQNDLGIQLSPSSAEEAVLGIFIQDDEAAIYVIQSGLSEDYFSRRRNKLLFPILLNVRHTKLTCNLDIVADACSKELVNGKSVLDLIGGPSYLVEILNTPVATDIRTTQAYLDILVEQYRLRKTKEAAKILAELNGFDVVTVSDKVADLQTILTSDPLNGQKGLISLDLLVQDSYDRYEDRHNNPEKYKGLHTGFYYIDLYKGVAKKRTTIVGARTSVGKSIFCSNMLVSLLLNGYKVLLFTPELDKEEYTDRMLCSLARISIDQYKRGSLTEAEIKRLSKANSDLLTVAGKNLYIEDRGSQSCGYIIGSIKRHMLNHHVDIVIVDYMQKLKYYGEAKKAITEMMDRFCAFGNDNNISMVVVSQLRRSEKPEPELNDLKESGDIENFADCVVLLHRPTITKGGQRNKAHYKIAKNRQGGVTDWVDLTFHEDCLLFEETDIDAEQKAELYKMLSTNEEEDADVSSAIIDEVD